MATKRSTAVRISENSHRSLHAMAAQSGEPIRAVLEAAIEQYRRQRFWAECHAAYTSLQQDTSAWSEYQAELALWETTLMDGLDPNEVWTDDDVVHLPEKT